MSRARKILHPLALIVFLILIETVCTRTPEAQGAAQAADPEALYQRGFAYFQQKDYAHACRDFQQAALHGNVASQSMIQMVNGYGYHCVMPSAQQIRNTPNPLPDIHQLYAGALREARAWRSDAVLTYAQISDQTHPGYYSTSFLFVSRSARQVLSLASAQFGGPTGPLAHNTEAAPLPENFVSLSSAVEQAHRAGMKGAMDDARLAVWQGRAGRLPGWLLHSPENALQTYLIGAIDGRAYPVSQYSYPVQGNDQQIQAMRQQASPYQSSPSAPAPRGNPCASSGMTSMAQRMNWFTPCNQAALQGLYRQSNSNYDMWMAGKRATPD